MFIIIFNMNKNVKNCLGTLLFISITQGSLAQEGDKKNLLFIITDQQRYDALGYAGNSAIQTPNLDRLAEQGAYFRNAYTPCAVCGPARSSILTGRTVENTGVKSNNETYFYEGDVMNSPTFDEVLAENGYRTEYYGKWHAMSFHAEVYENPVQFTGNGSWIFGGSGGQTLFWRDHLNSLGQVPGPVAGQFVDGMSKYPYFANPLDRFYGMTNEELLSSNQSHSQPDQHGVLQLGSEHTLTAFQATQTIEAIERLKDTLFSITCSFHFPHAPMLPPEDYYSMYPVEEMIPPVSIDDDMQNSPYASSNGRKNRTEYADPQKIKYMITEYYALVTEIDDWVGKILNKLDELGIAENTMVIFTSDHGEMLGAHGMREKNVFYEESAHIPLLIKFPGEIQPETTVEGYVSLIDLFPTILDYLNVPETESDGKSLRGLIDGTDTEHGQYVVTEWDRENTPNYMVVKDGWKLIIPYTIKSNVINAMYDLNTDPHEMNNLLGSNPDRAQYLEKAEELRACLLEWLEERNSIHYYSVSKRDLLEGGRPTGNDALFVSQDVPELVGGETIVVSITMKNSGQTAWTPRGQFRLGSQGPADNTIWGPDRVQLDEGDSIVPGAEKTFIFEVTVPDVDGIYNFQWQMVQDGEEWFGAKSELKQVISGNPGSYLDNCDATTDWKSSAGLTLNTTDQMQGEGCVEFLAASTDEFKKVFSPSYNSWGSVENTELRFWYYVSDASQFQSTNQVELGSAGKPDQDEFSWSLSGLTDGWNYITLKTSEANKLGNPNLSAINWFRIYRFKSGPVTTRIDAIQLIDPTVGPLYTLLVDGGSGAGNYPEGNGVTIKANNPPSGMRFDQWIIKSGTATLADKNAATTTLTMGAGPVLISSTYTDATSVETGLSSEPTIHIYPNPANNEFSLEVTVNDASVVSVSILDLSGRTVGTSRDKIMMQPGQNRIQLPVSEILPGTYLVKVTVNNIIRLKLLNIY
jgi:arylsulfatase A-like enzyme